MAINKIDIEIQRALADFMAGDERAANRFCRLLEPLLFEIAVGMLGGTRSDPEDAVQISLVSIVTHLRKRQVFEGSLTSFSAVVAANRCRDLLRRENRLLDTPEQNIEEIFPGELVEPLEDIIRDELRSELGSAMKKLDPPCRKLLIDIYYRKRSLKRVSEGLGLGSAQAVHYHLGICLKKLHQNFEILRQGRSIGVNAGEAGTKHRRSTSRED